MSEANNAAAKPAKKAAGKPKAEKKCAITKAQFDQHAKGMVVKIGDRDLLAAPKVFATGSLGWYAGEKIIVTIDGVPVKVQVGLNMTIVDSKEAE